MKTWRNTKHLMRWNANKATSISRPNTCCVFGETLFSQFQQWLSSLSIIVNKLRKQDMTNSQLFWYFSNRFVSFLLDNIFFFFIISLFRLVSSWWWCLCAVYNVSASLQKIILEHWHSVKFDIQRDVQKQRIDISLVPNTHDRWYYLNLLLFICLQIHITQKSDIFTRNHNSIYPVMSCVYRVKPAWESFIFSESNKVCFFFFTSVVWNP